MTFQDLASLAEVVGAIATVAALVYLAGQVRANTVSMKAESRRATFEGVSSALVAVAGDEELARIFNNGLVDFHGLNATDKTRFATLLSVFVIGLSVTFSETRIGIHESVQQASAVALLLRTPGGRQWWQTFRDRYDKDFRRYVETEILQGDPTAA